MSLRGRYREISESPVRRHPPPFGRVRLTRVARTPNDNTRLEVKPFLSPGCLPSARCSTSRSSEALRVPCYVRAKVLAPLSPASLMLSSSGRTAEPRYSVRSRFASRLPSIRRTRCFLTDLCNRLITRAPVDRSTSGLAARAADDRWMLPRPRSSSSERHRTTLRQSGPGWARA